MASPVPDRLESCPGCGKPHPVIIEWAVIAEQVIDGPSSPRYHSRLLVVCKDGPRVAVHELTSDHDRFEGHLLVDWMNGNIVLGADGKTFVSKRHDLIGW